MKKVGPTSGWAIIENDCIKIRTVSDTRRAAIVNWLCTERNLIVRNSITDDAIEALWHAECGDAICTTVTVTIAYGEGEQ